MPFLRLIDLRSGEAHEFETEEIRIGRDPDLEFTISEEGSDVVSGCHLRFLYRDKRWWLEDMASRNGTFISERRLEENSPEAVTAGVVVGLGKSGPQMKIEVAASSRLDSTLAEDATEEPLHVVLSETRTGQRFEIAGKRIRIGRGIDCEVRPSSAGGVSRVHAEILLLEDASVVIRDAGSVNGTYINGVRVGERELELGDRIELGRSGPLLMVEELALQESALPAPAEPTTETPTRSGFSNLVSTLVIRRLAAEVARRGDAGTRRLAWSVVAVIGALVVGLFVITERSERRTAVELDTQRLELEEQRRTLEEYRTALAAQRATTDSVLWAASIEYQHIWEQLADARDGAAPVAVIDSLRQALVAADQRSRAMEAALERAHTSLTRQLTTGDSLRREAEVEANRLRGELARARDTQVPGALLDSLRAAVREAERQVSGISQQIRAVTNVNLAELAQANQRAVGLVTAYVGLRIFDGSGFAITPSGYFVTNRHVARPDGVTPDSMFVTMADQRFMIPADVITVAGPDQPDLALLMLREYSGQYVEKVDWTGNRASQGEPAALIGFPAGLGAALDETRTVRTSMSAGIFSKVTSELIQFDGFTVEGSSGSPVFNANGEVVAVHRGSLRDATGLAFGVPVIKLIPLLPEAVKTELGVG